MLAMEHDGLMLRRLAGYDCPQEAEFWSVGAKVKDDVASPIVPAVDRIILGLEASDMDYVWF